ncbi:Oxysterol-binding protein-like protein 1 [Psilocybe cubensis]|uniref:Oxysterol-binding protein-like protein 1 n=2 Tax=Psilocybe cubensis TaxID=181762 RepID=A0ACB8GJR7_PSICU|nr:Oxysterol-binding protein-like protein 1 [Psilocybe cubensis]KAH9475771.1 Oxysterol-binding protein-like protein 1 [Psilocybe cubensis]
MAEATPHTSNAEIIANVEPLYQVKLLAALRNGDPSVIHPFLAEISKDKRKSVDGDIDTGAAALHLAVRCGSVQTVALLLAHRAISPNGIHPPGSGTTALHLAASLGRADVVNLLLEQENIDDSIRDNQGRTCRDVARNKDVIRTIDDSRSLLNTTYRTLLRSYIFSPINDPPVPALIQFLESPRIKFVDLSYLDNDSGTSLLHEAARRKDLRLIELAVRAGADVFVRNRKGKMAYEGTGKDDRVRVFLRQLANHDKTLIQNSAPLTEPPVLKGYLNKYTNVAKGYNTRWFVLRNGVLSYYRHQDDETVASRGSISMKTAVLHIAERNRFEVHSLPSKGSHNSITQKWYMKANHPVEAHRWTEAINKSIEWFKQRENGIDSDASSINASRRRSTDSEHSGIKSTPSMQSQSLSSHLWRKSAPGGSGRDRDSMTGSTYTYIDSADASPNLMQNDTVGPSAASHHTIENDGGEEDNDEEDSSSANSDEKTPPHSNFELQGSATSTQLELCAQLASNLSFTRDTPRRVLESHQALQESLRITQNLLNDFLQITREREDWWAKQLKKERARQHFWEESLATVVKEGETLERELRNRSRKRGSRVFGPSAMGSFHEKKRPTALGLTPTSSTLSQPLAEEPPSPQADGPPPPSAIVNTPKYSPPPPLPIPSFAVSPPTPIDPIPHPVAKKSPIRSPEIAIGRHPSPMSLDATAINLTQDSVIDDEYERDTDDEDEFFDAIESNNLPNLYINEGLKSPASDMSFSPTQAAEPSPAELLSLATLKGPLPQGTNLEQYAGYAHLRSRLAIGSDQRPSTSLWSVLKHSIGKDLTKISFPVFFNEPTSMLQRMAEDMEFSECLDVAAHESDPLRRIAFVAAFAMSNYSSTIGRIAKPFNPMLSETFEYVRLDRQYRYVSEQVSHHPPISACWAESPSWHYYGEVDAQNKFMGKSFEIRPTGVAHANLLLPEDAAPEYPRAQGELAKGKVLEHYSWKKVTTNVSGFILGSPTIDHYGDMVVTNHRTGDQCILTFKPRGWRGKDAYEISGQVIDHNGQVAYEIAGRWNSQLVAKKVGFGNGQLHPDISMTGPNSPSVAPEYILLWRNSDKPAGSPFNLTPFAITLNDCPQDTLRPFLCPTDCRLRPDQRAFELGKYELANDLKSAQEEKQRSIRRAREEGKLAPHTPRWFTAETDGDTGERVWSPVRTHDHKLEYWEERERVWANGGGATWKGVDPIFIEEPPLISELLKKTAKY